MNYDNLPSFSLQQVLALATAILLIALLLILFLGRTRLRRLFSEWSIQRELNQIGLEQIRNLDCPDGLDGHINIDRLALLEDRILIISYRGYSGNIYCSERIASWTQVIDQQSFKFENPLFDLENQLTSLRLLHASIPLQGCLYFGSNATFPKGHPDSVLYPSNLPTSFLRPNCKPANDNIASFWERLKQQKSETGEQTQLHAKT